MDDFLSYFEVVTTIIILWFLLYYFPNYFKEKAKNLATKEDVEEITRMVEKTKLEYSSQLEQTKVELNKDFETTIDEMKFFKERCFKQYCELYSRLYAVVVQSEYVRYFLDIQQEFNEVPFLEIHRREVNTTINLVDTSLEKNDQYIIDAVTDFNKLSIANLIIEKGELASEKLLKLAIAYRYVHNYYTNDNLPVKISEKSKDEELILIAKIVKTIVREANELKKNVNLEYNTNELDSGIMNWDHQN